MYALTHGHIFYILIYYIITALLTLANYKPGGYLWDPFMGSGTFLTEGLSFIKF